jgi:hypothetical protein
MKKPNKKLTLDRPAIYQILVRPVTILTGTLDQAALQGLLRRLYSLGLPLISATCIRYGSED